MSKIKDARSLLERLASLESDLRERQRLAEIAKRRRIEEAKDLWCQEAAPVLYGLWTKAREVCSFIGQATEQELKEEAQQAFDTITSTVRDVFQDGLQGNEERPALSENEILGYTSRWLYWRDRVEPARTPVAMKAVIEDLMPYFDIEEVHEKEFNTLKSRNSVITAAIRVREAGKPCDTSLANERRLALLHLTVQGRQFFYRAGEPFAQKVLHAFRTRQEASLSRPRTFISDAAKLQSSVTSTLKEVFLNGSTGSVCVFGHYGNSGAKGQRYSLLLASNGKSVEVGGVAAEGLEGVEDLFSALKGQSFAFKPNQGGPDLHSLPLELRRFITFQLSNAGLLKRPAVSQAENRSNGHEVSKTSEFKPPVGRTPWAPRKRGRKHGYENHRAEARS